MTQNLREIIKGEMLPRFNGKKISITGVVTQLNPNGITFEMRAVDDVLVKVNLRKPHRDPLEGLVEIHGTAQSGNTVICDNMIPISSPAEEFDAASHSKLCNLLNSVPDLYKTQ